MKTRHVSTTVRTLRLEVGYASDLGPAGLTEAIIEALGKGVLQEAGVVYVKAEAPGEDLMQVDIWAPEPVEESVTVPPAHVDSEADQPRAAAYNVGEDDTREDYIP